MEMLFTQNQKCKMKNRKNILNNLIHLNGNLNEIQIELSTFPWDINEPIVTITKNVLYSVLNKCIEHEITLTELENWANLIECRDDIDFENNEIQEIIFELANLEINGQITLLRLKEIAIDSSSQTFNE